MNEKNNLDDFIVTEDELDETLLVDTANPFLVRILPDGTPEYTPKFQKLSAARKLLVEIITKKIKFVKKVANTNLEEVSTNELINKKNNLGMSEESIKKSFNRELKDIVKKGKQGYYVPNYNLQKAKEYLEK